MILYCLSFYDTDGFTYGCDTVLGVFSERSKADEYALKLSENNKEFPLDGLTVLEYTLDIPWFDFLIEKGKQ